MTNVAEDLASAIGRELPDAAVTIDEPEHASSYWFIDIKRAGAKATVEWRPKQGFGIGFGVGGYGEGPDIIVPTVEAAVGHIVSYLLRTTSNYPEPPVLMASGDIPWRTAVEERLREFHVSSDTVTTLKEAIAHVLSQSYLVVVLDLTGKLTADYSSLRDHLSNIDSLIVTVASSDHPSSLDDFEFVMNKRVNALHAASVIQGLVAAAATGRYCSSPKSA